MATSSIKDKYLGKGIVFPFELPNGKVEVTDYRDLIKASIMSILFWPYGQRFFLGEYGSRVEELLGKQNTYVLVDVVKAFVVESISRWEKRIELLEASIEIPQNQPQKMEITLRYMILATRTEDSFVFPFYRKITT